MSTRAVVRLILALAAAAMLAAASSARKQASQLQAELAEVESELDRAMLEYSVIKLTKQAPIELSWNTTERTTIAVFYQYSRPRELVKKVEAWLSELGATDVEVKEYSLDVPEGYQLYLKLCKAAGVPAWPVDRVALMRANKLILISRSALTREVLEACLKYLEG
ncbi:MAG: hypothetical protein DRN96_09130 [Thermoproteota archaeon]|nr:MAG: hypothetical protein DRN96_09130 [Candidatus Korarchaeota archaeon]